MNNTGAKVIDEAKYGLYVWIIPDGRVVGDDDGNILNVPALRGDRSKIQMLTDAVRHYGINEGSAQFWAGNHRVTDEEFEEQKARLKFGLIPDPDDIPAQIEGLRDKSG